MPLSPTRLFPVLVDNHDVCKISVLGKLDNVPHLKLRLAFYEMAVGENVDKLSCEFVNRL